MGQSALLKASFLSVATLRAGTVEEAARFFVHRPDLAPFRETVAASEAMQRVTDYTGKENMEKFQSFLAD